MSGVDTTDRLLSSPEPVLITYTVDRKCGNLLDGGRKWWEAFTEHYGAEHLSQNAKSVLMGRVEKDTAHNLSSELPNMPCAHHALSGVPH